MARLIVRLLGDGPVASEKARVQQGS
jgi:hypothetical protein